MTGISEYNSFGDDFEKYLMLKTAPIAVKMLESEKDIPEGAIRPVRDMDTRIAQCQAFTLSRREGKSIALFLEDNNCFAPPIAYGYVDKPDDPQYRVFMRFPTFDRGKYRGIVSAPLKTANFKPDIVILYSNTAQMRSLIMPLHFAEKEDEIEYHFFPPACSYLIVQVMNNGKYLIALPDPGEHMRAFPGEDEIIISMPGSKVKDAAEGLKQLDKMKQGYKDSHYLMNFNFPHPPLYEDLFKRWGLSE